jgi:hypothetical protein
MFGLAIRIHEMTIRMPGMMMRPISRKPIRRASGVLVRSTTQAMKAPMTNASRVEASAKASVFVVVRQNDGLSKARM